MQLRKRLFYADNGLGCCDCRSTTALNLKGRPMNVENTIAKLKIAARQLPPNKALLRTNTKLEKGGKKYVIKGLTLAPHALSGTNVCLESTAGCRAACVLWFAGRRVMSTCRVRALADTMQYLNNRDDFYTTLRKNIESHVRQGRRKGFIPLVRLNVASDLDFTNIIGQFPDCRFYDYSKIAGRYERYLSGELPDNYNITYSASERPQGARLADYLTRGGNVAQVFDVLYQPAQGRLGELPTEHCYADQWFNVRSADDSDVRIPELDGYGNVLALRLKGTNAAKQRARNSGFAVRPMTR